MKSSVEPLEGNKVKVYVEVDEAEFDNDIDQAFKTIAREVKLPGFRNGKVPRRVLEARIGIGPAREQALRDAIPQYLGKAVREHEVDLVATPDVEITGGQADGIVEFEAECEIRPVITVPGYAGLRVELDSPEATEEEIQEAKDAELKQHGSLSDVDRPAESGDFLTLDLAATRDGEEVMGLNTEDWSYELGQGWVAEDFDEQIVGAKAGDVLTFSTTPKGTEEAADFTVTVKSVQALELPEATDEWVSENTGEFETVAEWEASIAEQVVERKLGTPEDLERLEEGGCAAWAAPEHVSADARVRGAPQLGTLGSGNHYLEVQEVSEIFDPDTATAYGISRGDIVVSIHCGSRGLGHQIGTEFLKSMLISARQHGFALPDRELST